MRKIKRYMAQIVWQSIVVVLFLIVALDTVSEVVDQVGRLRGGYTFFEALIYTVLNIPAAVYQYLPMACLVGCLVGLGILANSNELVVIRAAGMSVRQIIWAVMRPVLVLVLIGALIGEDVAPYASQYADSRRALALGHRQALQSERGVWNREGNEFMHFNAVMANGKLFGITRYRFDPQGNLEQSVFVESAIYQGGYWFEENGVITRFSPEKLERETFDTRRWESDVSPDLLNILVLEPEYLPMQRLYTYSNYLSRQGLDSSEYRLAFWTKALQPFTIASLVVIAISFILGPLRQTTMGFRVFIGVIVGLVFQTTQQMLAPTSIIMGFSPMFAVLIPIVVCFLIGGLLIRQAR